MSISLLSPAKINLFFRLLYKRLDGYHEVATLMQAVSLYDRIHLVQSQSDRITCNHPSLPCNERNLIWQSLSLFRKKTGKNFPVHIHLEKIIPIEAGLGGGSSNLATTMWGLNALAGHVVGESILQKWVGEISSDAPFFFSSGTGYATGRNEQVQSLSPLPKRDLWIVVPPWGMSTKKVYDRSSSFSSLAKAPEELLALTLRGEDGFVNDLEAAALAIEPRMQRFKKAIFQETKKRVMMTGSGSAFFSFVPLSSRFSDFPQPVRCFPVSFISRPSGKWFEDSRKFV